MSAEQTVKVSYPKARAERYKQNGPLGKSYWLIWSDFSSRPSTIRLAEGNTKSQAWKNAKQNIEKL